SEHFKQVFAAARRVGYATDDVKLEHIAFGVMLDKSGKPFKTRDGGTVKLKDLIDESIKRARDIISRANEYTPKELEKIAYTVGVGSLKYADLSINRQSNYIFDWDKMLSLDGNTALYMQYAYARINSILNRAKDVAITLETPLIEDELERRLALKILTLDDTLYRAYVDASPHIITGYLYELATLFMKFYELNPILKEGVKEQTKQSRLLIAKAVANAIKTSLNILGIDVLERI
ncbi:MAG TPA: arginine--tRNA ligase, partial [Campylobacterales bacterium]|nr:arginine--tRNA ligase [Campylobacterales bacterium]